MTPRVTLRQLNEGDRHAFVRILGSLYEHSPWVAERTWDRRPFDSLAALHRALSSSVDVATADEQFQLIKAHPDLVGRIAREGRLTTESTAEQSAAGLGGLTGDEIAAFDRYNAAYRERFGFPFVICARENKKDAILAAFPIRLKHERSEEIATALAEIGKIAWLRLLDRVRES